MFEIFKEFKEMNSELHYHCLSCGKGPMVTDNSSGEMFCGNCGFVVTERIEETGPEW